MDCVLDVRRSKQSAGMPNVPTEISFIMSDVQGDKVDLAGWTR